MNYKCVQNSRIDVICAVRGDGQRVWQQPYYMQICKNSTLCVHNNGIVILNSL